ncbi:MAG: carbon storage regulator CsrA [Gemmatimonadetes bacterium]|nr:carbon storage regulator CsrA [Gemmatimonadota bacterium]
MLILARRPDEAVLLGDDIRLIVLSTDGETVRLGIEAPPDVQILREEIVAAIANENRRARASNRERDWLGPLREVETDRGDSPQVES